MSDGQGPALSAVEASAAFSSAAEAAARSVYPGQFRGDGIVIPAGGERYFPNAWVCVHRLRAMGCRLPIQIWHLGREEINPAWAVWLAHLGVEFVDAFAQLPAHPHRKLTGWPLKPYAMQWSPFARVLLIDADNAPVRDPTFLFSAGEFLETGAIFWPDLWSMYPDHPIWGLCGLEPRTEREFESGQILLDKSRCWSGLCLTNWMNEHADTWYHHLHGDKDTFRVSWHRLSLPCAMPHLRAPDMPGKKYIRQYDFRGELLFQHRCAAKWRRDDSNERLPHFLHETECLDAIDDLRRRYEELLRDRMGRAFNGLWARPWAYLEEGRRSGLPVTFRADGSIRQGADGRLAWWNFDHGRLTLYDPGFVPIVTLKPAGDGCWSSLETPLNVAVRLEAIAPSSAMPSVPSADITHSQHVHPSPRSNAMPPAEFNPRQSEPLDLISVARDLPGPLTVVDVGCRWGFADRWLELGERISLFGFDPDQAECARLAERHRTQPHIQLIPRALSSFNGMARLHLTRDPGSSSLYPPDPEVIASHPEIRRCLEPVGTSEIEVVRLADWADQAGVARIDFLKLDVQGAELDVLMGAGRILDGITGIEAEVEFNPMYLGQPLFSDIDRYLRAHGFRLWRLGHLVHYGRNAERTDQVQTQELSCYDARGFFLPGQGGTLFWGHALYLNARLSTG